MKITVGITPGHGHTESQDVAFFNQQLRTGGVETLQDTHFRCIGLCDGVGGNAGGRIAAEFAAARMTQTDFPCMKDEDIPSFLQQLNSDLLRHAAAHPGRESMAATISCILRSSGGIYLVHGGNTRIYTLQGAYLKQLTEDHTHRARLLRSGQKEAAEQCPGHIIYCALGGGTELFAGNLVLRKLPWDTLPGTLVLTSDGIHDHLSEDELEEIISGGGSDPDRIRRLMDAALEKGSRDDMTVIIARN